MSKENEYTFDKFVEDIVRREEEQRQRLKEYAEEHADTPQRRYNDLYRERWQNRVRYDNQRKK
jgi:hypothetical protein